MVGVLQVRAGRGPGIGVQMVQRLLKTIEVAAGQRGHEVRIAIAGAESDGAFGALQGLQRLADEVQCLTDVAEHRGVVRIERQGAVNVATDFMLDLGFVRGEQPVLQA